MITYDDSRTVDVEAPDTKVVRDIPILAAEHTCAHSKAVLKKVIKEQLENAKVEDDPVLIALEKDYVGQFMFEFDKKPKKARKHHKCVYVSTGVYKGSDYYGGTCVPVVLGEDGPWVVPEKDLVQLEDGGTSQDHVKNDSLWGVLLYDEGREPMKQGYADAHMKAHKDLITTPEGPASNKRKNM
jgi:hypothetical protein